MSLTSQDSCRTILRELVALPQETEWAEFKHNATKPEDLGEYISALANSAALGNRCQVHNAN